MNNKLILDISLDNGKYTLPLDDSGRLIALRYGEPWRDLVGDKLVLALAQEVEKLRIELNLLCLSCGN